MGSYPETYNDPKFSHLFSTNTHPGKLHCTFSPQKLARLFPLEAKPRPIAKLKKIPNIL